jgi:hypothetical protein
MTVYKTTILPVVLHGCEAWCLTMRKKQKLIVFEDRVLKNIFGPIKDQVTEEWRRLCSILLTKYYLGDQIQKNMLGGA